LTDIDALVYFKCKFFINPRAAVSEIPSTFKHFMNLTDDSDVPVVHNSSYIHQQITYLASSDAASATSEILGSGGVFREDLLVSSTSSLVT